MQGQKTKRMLQEEERLGRPLEEAITETYNRWGSMEATGEALGIKPHTLYIWSLRLGLVRQVRMTSAQQVVTDNSKEQYGQ